VIENKKKTLQLVGEEQGELACLLACSTLAAKAHFGSACFFSFFFKALQSGADST
jgi:hypothetical protein